MEMILDPNWKRMGIDIYSYDEKDNKFYIECLELIDQLKTDLIVLDDDYVCIKDIPVSDIVKNKSNIIFNNVDLNIKLLSDGGLENDSDKTIFDIPIIPWRMRYIDTINVSFEFPTSEDILYIKRILCSYSFSKNFLEASLMHEYGHVLIYKNPGTLKNYIHNEYIPIVLELLYHLINNEFDIFKEVLKHRLIFLKTNILKLNTQLSNESESPAYVQSTLEALLTISKYLDSSSKEQDITLSYLKNILNGKDSVERFIVDNDITFKSESPQKELKKLLGLII